MASRRRVLGLVLWLALLDCLWNELWLYVEVQARQYQTNSSSDTNVMLGSRTRFDVEGSISYRGRVCTLTPSIQPLKVFQMTQRIL